MDKLTRDDIRRVLGDMLADSDYGVFVRRYAELIDYCFGVAYDTDHRIVPAYKKEDIAQMWTEYRDLTCGKDKAPPPVGTT